MRRTHRAKGISIFFKGKLGKKGSVKKSTFFNKIGLVSLSRKDLRFNYRTFIISTHTGVIGANISVFFNGYVYIRNNVCIILYHSSSTYTSIFSNFSFSKKSYAVYLRSNLTRYFSICSKFLNLQTNTVPISRITTCFYFFLKFTFVVDILKFATLFVQVLVFLNFLLGMFFYLQIFVTTNKIYVTQTLRRFISESKISLTQKFTEANKKYMFFKSAMWFLFFSLLSFIFFFDIFIILLQYQV